MKIGKGWIFSITLFAMSGCYYDKEEQLYPGSNIDCTTVHATFVNVKPIIAVRCATAGCHNAEAAAGATVLVTYDQIKAKADRINQRTVVERSMPAGTALSADEIAILKCWITSGAPNN